MDKILSARIDESILCRLNMLAKSLRMSKKSVLEGAILAFAEKINAEDAIDILKKTSGAWQREESVEKTVEHCRKTFRTSMTRHQV
jgi:predicted transcriptional regulator